VDAFLVSWTFLLDNRSISSNHSIIKHAFARESAEALDEATGIENNSTSLSIPLKTGIS
jgi:hypothetical protein